MREIILFSQWANGFWQKLQRNLILGNFVATMAAM